MKEIDEILKNIEDAYKTAEGREVVGCALPILLNNGERSYCIYLESDPYNLCREKVIQTFNEELFFGREELLSGLKQVTARRLEDVYSGLEKKKKSAKKDIVFDGTIASIYGGIALLNLLFPPAGILGLIWCFNAGLYSYIGAGKFKDKKQIEKAMEKVNKLKDDWEKEIYFVPEALEESKGLAGTVYEEREFDGCSSPLVYRGIRRLVMDENKDVDSKCISKYRELIDYFDAVETGLGWPEGMVIYPPVPKVSFTTIGINFVGLYKNNPKHFKALFTKLGEKKRREVLKEISSLKDRSEELDEWLSEYYPLLSKEAAMGVI